MADESPRRSGTEQNRELRDRFSAALAGLFARRSETPPPAEPESLAEDDIAAEPADDNVAGRTILEAMLFVGNPQAEPLTPEAAAATMRGVAPAEIDEMVAELNAQYEADGCPYEIVSRGGGYWMALRDEYDGLRRQIDGRMRQARLSAAAIETLSIVAYHPGLTAEEVSRHRGAPSTAALSLLVRRALLRIERAANERRPRYFTTSRFLELLGLETLDDLPRQEEPR